MGIFDKLTGASQEVMNLISNHEGGLSGLVEKLKTSGLGEQVNSWIGLDPNQPVDGSQISSALGGDVVKNIAEKLGISHEEAANHVAEALPKIVDKLTPNGKVEDEGLLQKGISALKGLFG